jgi:hypothetical protein
VGDPFLAKTAPRASLSASVLLSEIKNAERNADSDGPLAPRFLLCLKAHTPVRQVLTLELVIVKEKKFWLRRCGLWPSFAYEVSLVAQHLLKLGAHLTTALARLQVQNLARKSSLEVGSTREKTARRRENERNSVWQISPGTCKCRWRARMFPER